MASLDEEITALKAKIEGYELTLNDPTISDLRYDKLLDLIKSCRDNLTELGKRKNAQSAVGGAGVLSAGRHLYLRKCLS